MPKYFESDTDVLEVLVHGTVTLPCKTSAHSTVVWQHQQFCDNFEHGMCICSNPVEVAIGNRYQIHRNASGENNLAINYVTKNMTGLYMCKDRDSDVIHYKALLNVISKYNSVIFAVCFYDALYIEQRFCFAVEYLD